MAGLSERVRTSGGKRKHEDGGHDAQARPVKKSKSGERNQRRRDRFEEKWSRTREADGPLDGHRARARSRRDLKKSERRRQKEAAASATSAMSSQDIVPHGNGHGQIQDSSKPSAQRKLKRKTNWTLSNPAAGRFLEHDPVFAHDSSGHEYVLAAVDRELQVLSLESSLLIRALPSSESTSIVGFALESPDSNLVHVAHGSGQLVVWDWTNDNPPLSMLSLTGQIKGIAASSRRDETERAKADLTYIARLDDLHVVTANGNSHKTEKALDSIQVLDNGKYVLAMGRDTLVIGRKRDDERYTWMELPFSTPACCMDARVLPTPSSLKKTSKRQPQLQLAIGTQEGQIHLYNDISTLFSEDSQRSLPAPRILHWHRSAVSSVKFSPDGNYVISGGKETVLVLWQLETGHKQYLPHLTSEIQRISVNLRGDRYALQMGDNSIMVISTAELKPVANFAGLQMQTTEVASGRPPAAALHPKSPKQLLVMVPPTQPDSLTAFAPRPFLQTFDLHTARHVTRQALTRNNTTDFNTGPESNAILSPDVVHLALSADGQWLATIDEWVPPASDVTHLVSSPEMTEEAILSRREVYLKIWLWDGSEQIWTLSTRADSPHRRAGLRSAGAGRVLALISDPTTNCFTTVGEDDCVKMWKPKARMRGGVAMKDAQELDLVEWTCRRSVQLSSSQHRADSPMELVRATEQPQAAAAFSSDGSLLAVATTTPNTMEESVPAIALIDTATGTIKSMATSLSDGSAITTIAFIERFIICVTHNAVFVWDLVKDEMSQKIKLAQEPYHEPLLAVNEADQTFALVTPSEKKDHVSRLAVHSTRHPGRANKEDFGTRIVKILAGKGSRGFVLLFADATVRTISPMGAAGNLRLPAFNTALASVSTDVEMGNDKPEEDAGAGALVGSSAAQPETIEGPAFDANEDDRPVVRPEQLASIFDVGQSFAMQPVKDMFHSIVGLFGRKPQPVAA